jgi:hypothetical protein
VQFLSFFYNFLYNYKFFRQILQKLWFLRRKIRTTGFLRNTRTISCFRLRTDRKLPALLKILTICQPLIQKKDVRKLTKSHESIFCYVDAPTNTIAYIFMLETREPIFFCSLVLRRSFFYCISI